MTPDQKTSLMLDQDWQAINITGPQSHLLPIRGGLQRVAHDWSVSLHRMGKLHQAVTADYEGNTPVGYDASFLPEDKIRMYRNPYYTEGKNAELIEDPQKPDVLYDAVEQCIDSAQGKSLLVNPHYFVMMKVVAEVMAGKKKVGDDSLQSAVRLHTVYSGNDKNSTRYKAEKQGIEQAGVVFVSTNYEAEQLIVGQYGDGVRSKIVKAPLGIDEHILNLRFLSEEERNTLRTDERAQLIQRQRNLGNEHAADILARTTDKTVVFSYVGRIVPSKRIEQLIAGYEEFRSQNPGNDSLLLLDSLMDVKEERYYREVMAAIKHNPNIAVVEKERGAVFHTVADVNCILSVPTYETYSLVAAEFDGASIVTNGGPFPEVVPHGLFVNPTSPMDISQAMETSMNPAYRSRVRHAVQKLPNQPTMRNNMKLSLEGLVSHSIIPPNSYRLSE